MHTNIRGQSDIVTQPTNTWNKVYQEAFILLKGFFTTTEESFTKHTNITAIYKDN
jgi:hypothetical protein